MQQQRKELRCVMNDVTVSNQVNLAYPFSVLQATESWVRSGNEANCHQHYYCHQNYICYQHY